MRGIMTTEEANKIIAEYMDEKELCIYYPDSNTWDCGHSKQYTVQKQNSYYQQGISCELKQRSVNVQYSESLDLLVPAWEKLSIHGAWLNINRHGLDHYQVVFIDSQNEGEHKSDYNHCVNESLQVAAAVATAYCIQKVDNR